MKWLRVLWVLSCCLAFTGCMQMQSIVMYLENRGPLTPYNAGYHDGCAVKKDKRAEHRYHQPLGGQFEVEYSLGFSDGYALCSKGMIRPIASSSRSRSSSTFMAPSSFDKDAHLPPYERYKKKKHMTKAERACVEKRRLCFPASRD